MFKELDSIIQDHCLMGSILTPEQNEVDDNKYDMLKAEINAHIQGTKKLNELSQEAQEIMQEWERFELQQKGVTDV